MKKSNEEGGADGIGHRRALSPRSNGWMDPTLYWCRSFSQSGATLWGV